MTAVLKDFVDNDAIQKEPILAIIMGGGGAICFVGDGLIDEGEDVGRGMGG